MTPKSPHRPGDPDNLVDPGLFNFLVNLEVHKAARLQYPISVLCLTVDLPVAKAEQALRESLAQLAAHDLRATDVASSFRTAVVAILLVGAETQHLPGILARLRATLEAPAGRRGRTDRCTMSAGGGCYPHTATSGRELLQQAEELMTRAQTDGGDRAYLPS